jgi:rubrerythrin
VGHDNHQVPAAVGNPVEREMSRGDALLKGALAIGSLYGLSAVGPYVRRALAAEGSGDVSVLEYLLPFEYMQHSLYNRARSEKNSRGEEMPLKDREKELVDLLFAQEEEHVAAVTELIEEMGGEVPGKGNYTFAFRLYIQFLDLADTVESTAVEAYNYVIPTLESPEARDLVSSITQVDARHSAIARVSDGKEPAPEPFDQGAAEPVAISHVVQFTNLYTPEEWREAGK